MVNFEQAVRLMKEGNKVRKESWGNKEYNYGMDERFIRTYTRDECSNELIQVDGQDWEIYKGTDIDQLIDSFNKFIDKWCGNMKGHLLDSDDNDGEFFRNKLRKFALQKGDEQC